MIDILKTQETTMLSCVASHSRSGPVHVYITVPVCIPGQFGDSIFVPHGPSSLAGQLQPLKVNYPRLTLSSWKNDRVLLQHRWNYRVQKREQY